MKFEFEFHFSNGIKNIFAINEQEFHFENCIQENKFKSFVVKKDFMEKYCFPVEGKYQSFFIVHFEKDLDIKLSKSYQWRAQIPRKHSNK